MCRIVINDMSSRMAMRSLIRGPNNDEGNAIQANINAIRGEIQTRRNDIIDIKQTIEAKEARISQIDRKIKTNERIIANGEKLIENGEKVIDNTEKLIASNEELIASNEKLIENNEKLIAKEEDLLKDIVGSRNLLQESRDMQKVHIDTLKESRVIGETKAGLMRQMISKLERLIKLKQDEANKPANFSMKDVSQPLPQPIEASNNTSSKQVDNILSAARKGIDKHPKFDHKRLRGETNQVFSKSSDKNKELGKNNKFVNERVDFFSSDRFHSMLKSYRAEMKSLDRMLSTLRIKA